MATPNSMEIVQEGALESISRPTSSNTRHGNTGESASRPSTTEGSFMLELLPADSVCDELSVLDGMTIEDVVDSDTDLGDIDAIPREDANALEILNVGEGRGAPDIDYDLRESPEGKRPGSTDSSKSEVDPKIAKGLEKIKKLDSLLEEVARKEKDAKEDRRRVEKELRLQLRGLLEEKSSVLKRVGHNVQHLLALCESDVSDEVKTTGQLHKDEFSPVFQTQIDIEDDMLGDKRKDTYSDTQSRTTSGKGSQSSTRASSHRSSASDNGGKRRTRGNSSKNKDGKKSKAADKSKQQNFIEKNIKLASHAGDVVAITDEERKRLDELLSDESDLFTEGNPFSTMSVSMHSSGYSFDSDASASLLRIDARLKELIPDEEYNSICLTDRSDGTTTASLTSGMPESTRGEEGERSSRQDTLRDNQSLKSELASSRIPDMSVSSTVDNDDDCCGEQTLQERKKHREMQQRLTTIEKQLKDMQVYDEVTETTLPLISNELLRQLLDVDSRATSTAMSIKDVVSGRLSVSDAAMSDLTSCLSTSEYGQDNMSGIVEES